MSEIMKDLQDETKLLLKAGLWMCLLNGIVLNLISYHYLSVADPTTGFVESLYLYSFSFTHFFFVALIPFLIIYIPIAILRTHHKKRACMISGSVAYGIYLILMVIDSFVFYLYRFHVNGTVVEQLVGPGAGQVFELSSQMYIIAAIVISLIFGFEVLLFKAGYKLAQKEGYTKEIKIAVAIFGIYACCQVAHAVASAKGDRAITRCDRYFPLCKPLNINSQLVAMGIDAPLKYKMQQKGHQYNYPLHPIISQGGTKQNIIIIALDSWTYNSMDSINCPNIYRFSKKCSQFNHHYSGGNCTRNGVFSMFYGLPGYYWYDFMNQHISPVFVDELVKDQYDIRLYPSASMQNPAFDKNVFCKVAEQCGATEGAKAWERDRNLALNFIKDLKNKKGDHPIFSLLFFDSLHSMILPDSTEYKAPFQPTWEAPKYLEVNNTTEPEPFYNLYKNMLFYLDGYFAQVIDAIGKAGMMDNTVIIVTGDHGQEFNENHHNFWGHNGNFSAEQVQVPFLYYSPSKKATQYNHWSSHYDLVPTLMTEILGVHNDPRDYCNGHSLFDTTPRDYMYCDGYNGLAITETNGNKTDIFYDGDYQITDRHLNQLLDAKLDTNRINSVLKDMRRFYSSNK